jgi:nitrogenase-stabilizing/protective protein
MEKDSMDSLTQRLQALSSAEDFLQFFGIPFDERVVQVSRLHILKRFYQYLHKTQGLEGLDDIQLFRRYRELLGHAYEDFVSSTPAQERVFRVLQEADGTRRVGLEGLRNSLSARRSVAGTA